MSVFATAGGASAFNFFGRQYFSTRAPQTAGDLGDGDMNVRSDALTTLAHKRFGNVLDQLSLLIAGKDARKMLDADKGHKLLLGEAW
jgi:hypothetical protein